VAVRQYVAKPNRTDNFANNMRSYLREEGHSLLRERLTHRFLAKGVKSSQSVEERRAGMGTFGRRIMPRGRREP